MTPTDAESEARAPGEWTIAAALREGARRLTLPEIDNPRLEARMLLAHALGRTPESLIRDLHDTIDPEGFFGLAARRATDEPMAYILGWREFWSLRFEVSPATLIPRPDSETLVEAALDASPKPGRVLDLGIGTGCLLLSVLHERPGAFGIGVDIAPEAAALARRNAWALGLGGRTAFLCGYWAAAIAGRFDLVLSNPPYIETEDLASLMTGVVAFEPRTALDGGPGGLVAYRAIVAALPDLLTPGGTAVLELGLGQYDAVAALAAAAGYRASARADLAGIARAIVLRRGG